MQREISAAIFERYGAAPKAELIIHRFRYVAIIKLICFMLCIGSVVVESVSAKEYQQGSNDIRVLIEDGKKILDEGDIAESLQVLQEALEIDPDNSAANYLMGLAHFKKKDYKQAIEYLGRAIDIDPFNVDARMQIAVIYEVQDLLDDAIGGYSHVVQWSEPGTIQFNEAIKKIRYLTATQLAKRGEIDSALGIFEGLAELYPEDSLIVYSAGVAYRIKGRMNDAGKMFERVLELDPGYLYAYLNLADVYEVQGKLDKAISNWKHVAEEDPQGPAGNKANARLGIIEARFLAQDGNYEDAITAYNKVLQLDPANSIALTARPNLYKHIHDKNGEQAAYQELLAVFPKDQASRIALSDIYLADGKYADAYDNLTAVIESGDDKKYKIEAQRRLARMLATDEGKRLRRIKAKEKISAIENHIQEHPDDLEASRQLASLYYGQGMYQQSVDLLRYIIDRMPEDKQAHFAMAVLYDKLGKFSDSVDEYLWLLSRPGSVGETEKYSEELKLVNAKKLYIEGNLKSSAREFDEILAEAPDNSIAYFYLGLILTREDDIAGAADAYREVTRLSPSHVGARLNLAYSYERLNREEDAIDEYRKILQASPAPETAATVKARLGDLESRIHGISVNAGYLMVFDSNSNLSDSDAQEDYRSDLSLNLSYQYKTDNGYRWRITVSPIYSNYHKGRYDFLHATETAAVSSIRGAFTIVGGYSHKTTDGLLIDSRLSRTDTLFTEMLTRKKLPNLIRMSDSEMILSNITLNLSYSDFDSTSSPFFSSYTTAAGINVSQPVTKINNLRLGYSFVVNENKEFVGSDYAYRSHGISAGLDHLMSWGSINANIGVTLINYTNPDSFSQFTEHRENIRSNLAFGATYRYRPNLNLFTTWSWTDNRSTLPVGFILNSEDIIEGQQSSSLSNYVRTMLTAGMNVKF